MSDFLNVSVLSCYFGGVKAVDGVSFNLARRERVAIIGPNGAGKSTCFNLLCGQILPLSGRVEFEGENITGLSSGKIAAKGIARTFQTAQVFRSLSVRDNIRTVIEARLKRSLWLKCFNIREIQEEIDELLSKVGLFQIGDRLCSSLSYGDFKRLEFAIALAGKPKLLMMDEPTAGMAQNERFALMELVDKMADEAGFGLLFCEHDMDVVFGHAERVIVLHRGRVLSQGRPQEVRADIRVQETYLGKGQLLTKAGH